MELLLWDAMWQCCIRTIFFFKKNCEKKFYCIFGYVGLWVVQWKKKCIPSSNQPTHNYNIMVMFAKGFSIVSNISIWTKNLVT